MLAAGGAIFGLAGGYIIIRSQGGFRSQGTPAQWFLRYVIGFAGVLVIRYGLGMIFPENPNLIGFGFRYLRYALIGAWISWWAPLVFIRFHLAESGIKTLNIAEENVS